MTEIRLQNPYMDETIKVKENYKLIRDMLEWLGRGNIDYLQLQQKTIQAQILDHREPSSWQNLAIHRESAGFRNPV